MKNFIAFLFLSLLFVGNINSQSITLSVIQPECNGDGIMQATVSGITPPYDIAWYGQMSNLNSIQSNIFTTTVQSTNMSSSTYFAEIIQGGLTIATSQTISLPRVVNSLTPFQTSVYYSCPATSASPTLNISGGTAPYSILWENMMTGVTTTSGNLPEGDYNYTITDANGCKYYTNQKWFMWIPIRIQYFSGINFNINTTAANCTNGTAVVSNITGGTAPYTYLWNNGATTSNISNLSSGNVNVTLTDANGCYTNNNVIINQTPTITVGTTVTDATCLLSNGSATVFASGGQAPYSYQWSNGQTTPVINNQLPSGFNVRATDANGCFNYGSAYIQTTTPITVTYISSVSQCTIATGSSTLTLTGGQAPYSVTWNVTPAQTGTVLSNVLSGQYNFNVSDANGCLRNGIVNIGTVSNMNGSISVIPAMCNLATGGAVFNSPTGIPPFTYNWSTGVTTSSITNVPQGIYSCTLTDAANCNLVKSVNVYTTSPIQIGFNTTPASCIFSSDGAINSNVVNGTAPYTYQWSNGNTSQNLINQAPGHYYLTITDASGCVITNHIYLPSNNSNSNCYCLITGTVYDDTNTNCILDGGENGIPYVKIYCSGIGYAYSDMNGVYTFSVPAGTYTLTEQLNSNYQINGCQSNTTTIVSTPTPGCMITTNFANTVIPIHDLHIITTSVNQPVPGNNYQQKMIVVNEGTYTENTIQLSHVPDGQLIYSNSTLPLTQPNSGSYPNWYSVSSGFASLSPSASSTDVIDYLVPTNVPFGTVVNFKDTVSSMAPVSTSWTSDFTPWNNVSNYNAVVVSSFDPNFKEVTPKGIGPYGIISYNDTILEYVIHFQNTGTYYAQNIYVLDTLDSDLDWTTFQPGYADHDYSASMDLNGVVKFSFNNINLPYNGPPSNGMVSYRIKTKKNLIPGTEFRNKAAIFFDYNAPIVTNTTINSLQILSGTNENVTEISSLNLYPNPTNGTALVRSQSNFNKIEVLSVTGQILLFETVNTTSHQIQLQNFAEGIYFVKISYADGRSLTRKIIKQ